MLNFYYGDYLLMVIYHFKQVVIIFRLALIENALPNFETDKTWSIYAGGQSTQVVILAGWTVLLSLMRIKT